jgi:hypothetical protein
VEVIFDNLQHPRSITAGGDATSGTMTVGVRFDWDADGWR